eukprot:191070_1
MSTTTRNRNSKFTQKIDKKLYKYVEIKNKLPSSTQLMKYANIEYMQARKFIKNKKENQKWSKEQILAYSVNSKRSKKSTKKKHRRNSSASLFLSSVVQATVDCIATIEETKENTVDVFSDNIVKAGKKMKGATNNAIHSIKDTVMKAVEEVNKTVDKVIHDTPLSPVEYQLKSMQKRKEISWTQSVFPLDTQYAIIRVVKKQQIQVYECTPDLQIENCQTKSSTFISEFLDIDGKESESIFKTIEDFDHSLVGIGYKYNSYSIDFENFRISRQSIPIWMVVATQSNAAICQILMGKVNIINNHLYINQSVAALKYNCIELKCDMFVFGLSLEGQLKLQKKENVLKMKVGIQTSKDGRLGMSPIINHFKQSFPKYSILFDAFSLMFNTEFQNFKCIVDAEMSLKDDKKDDKKQNSNKYSIDLSFQPVLNPGGAIAKFLEFLGFDYTKFQEIFPLKLYLKGDNEDGYKIGAELKFILKIKKWLFGEFILLDSVDWTAAVEANDKGSVILSACAGINGIMNLSKLHDKLSAVALRGHIKTEINIKKAEFKVEMGFAIQFPSCGWDPFSVIDLDSGFCIKSLYMGFDVAIGTGGLSFNIKAAGNLSFVNSDIIIAKALKIIPQPYPTPPIVILEGFYFELSSDLDMKLLLKNFNLDLEFINFCPDIKIKNCMFSWNATMNDMNVPFGINFIQTSDDIDEPKKELTLEEVLKMDNIDNVEMCYKEKQIKQGLIMNGTIVIGNVFDIYGEMILTKEKIGMTLDACATGDEKEMDRLKDEIKNGVSKWAQQYTKTLFPSPEEFKKNINAAIQIIKDNGLYDKVNEYTNGKLNECVDYCLDMFFEIMKTLKIFDGAKIMEMMVYDIIMKTLNCALDNITITKLLIDLQIPFDSSKIKNAAFKFEMDMKIKDLEIQLDFDTSKDLNLEYIVERIWDAFKNNIVQFAEDEFEKMVDIKFEEKYASAYAKNGDTAAKAGVTGIHISDSNGDIKIGKADSSASATMNGIPGAKAHAGAKTYTISDKNGDLGLELATVDSSAEASLIDVRFDVKATLVKGNAGPFSGSAAIGIETGAGIKDNSLDCKIAGTGFTIGQKVGMSFMGSNVEFDFGWFWK